MSGEIFLLIWIALLITDTIFYGRVVRKHGPQWNYWPLGGLWLAWKHRNK